MKSMARALAYRAMRQPHGGDRKSAQSKCNAYTSSDAATIVAQQYGKTRKTVYNDVRFAKALFALARTCGDELRQRVLNRTVKLTRNDLLQLVQMPEVEQMRYV